MDLPLVAWNPQTNTVCMNKLFFDPLLLLLIKSKKPHVSALEKKILSI